MEWPRIWRIWNDATCATRICDGSPATTQNNCRFNQNNNFLQINKSTQTTKCREWIRFLFGFSLLRLLLLLPLLRICCFSSTAGGLVWFAVKHFSFSVDASAFWYSSIECGMQIILNGYSFLGSCCCCCSDRLYAFSLSFTWFIHSCARRTSFRIAMRHICFLFYLINFFFFFILRKSSSARHSAGIPFTICIVYPQCIRRSYIWSNCLRSLRNSLLAADCHSFPTHCIATAY